ncbi:hypothetical protein V6N12_022232 [Hibiscus sabdariffa]|uniref:Uncharacterized protein n=1 Tax=Hibiscus sabdariffa TaxID=183260 RepID=A0ABR2FU20_9ROSI
MLLNTPFAQASCSGRHDTRFELSARQISMDSQASLHRFLSESFACLTSGSQIESGTMERQKIHAGTVTQAPFVSRS